MAMGLKAGDIVNVKCAKRVAGRPASGTGWEWEWWQGVVLSVSPSRVKVRITGTDEVKRVPPQNVTLLLELQ